MSGSYKRLHTIISWEGHSFELAELLSSEEQILFSSVHQLEDGGTLQFYPFLLGSLLYKLYQQPNIMHVVMPVKQYTNHINRFLLS